MQGATPKLVHSTLTLCSENTEEHTLLILGVECREVTKDQEILMSVEFTAMSNVTKRRLDAHDLFIGCQTDRQNARGRFADVSGLSNLYLRDWAVLNHVAGGSHTSGAGAGAICAICCETRRR